MAEPNSKQPERKGSQPISRHPLFPAIVGLWFAALLGLGSFALSTSLLEQLVLTARIDSLIPAAAPPLGLTARLMLALMLGVPGGALGWALARQMAAPKSEIAPQVFKVAEAGLGARPQWPGMAEAPALAAPTADSAPVLDPASLVHATEDESPPPAVTASMPAAEAIVEQEAIPTPSTPTAAQRIADAELAELSHVELVERLAIALQRREERLGTAPAEVAEVANPVLHFPDFADRRGARAPLPAAQSRPAPQETEKALREALAQLQRMSGGA